MAHITNLFFQLKVWTKRLVLRIMNYRQRVQNVMPGVGVGEEKPAELFCANLGDRTTGCADQWVFLLEQDK